MTYFWVNLQTNQHTRMAASSKLSHVNDQNKPAMVDVSRKEMTRRVAEAMAEVWLGPEVVKHLQGDDIVTPKGPVFQTAILAGVMAAKKTSDLIPFCHPLPLEDCQIKIVLAGETAHIHTSAVTTAKTGVEMEALTAASVAALTIYDMCKALTPEMVIGEVCLLSKTGGKTVFNRKV